MYLELSKNSGRIVDILLFASEHGLDSYSCVYRDSWVLYYCIFSSGASRITVPDESTDSIYLPTIDQKLDFT